MSEPNTPPVPPVPPAPQVPPVQQGTPAPRFGEFAPVETATPEASALAPDAAPVASGSQPIGSQPTFEQPAAQPAYGQPAYGQLPYGQLPSTPAATAAPRRKVWDIVLTIVLLTLGLGGMLIGVLYGALLPLVFDAVYTEYGLSSYQDDGSLQAPVAVIVGSHLVLYVLALGLSILLLVKRKIAFYVPLVAGVIATIVFWSVLVSAILNDSVLISYLGLTSL